MFKGTLDFYVHRGIPCCRAWPRYRPHEESPDELSTQAHFQYIVSLEQTLPSSLIEAVKPFTFATKWTWRDMMTSCYLKGHVIK